jgi:hypothetical protein
MINIIPSGSVNKPNRVSTPEAGKDDKYHAQYGRYVASSCYNSKYQKFQDDYNTNRRFYKNDQWWVDEDKATFLMDDNGETNNRIQVIRNFIQPMVEQYRGNAERMTFTSKVISLSPLVKAKREELLNRLLVYQDVARMSPNFGQFIRKEFPNIGATEQETVSTFNNLFVDKYLLSLNSLLRSVREMNKLPEYRKILAQDIALSGMGVMKPYIHSGHFRFSRVAPDRFGWDTEARLYDLSDAQHFLEQNFYMVSELAEMYQLDPKVVASLERYVSNVVNRGAGGNMYNTDGRIPTYTAVWRDIVVDEFGYVYSKSGSIVLKRLNDESVPEEERVSDKDLVPYSKLNTYQKRVVKENKRVSKANLYVDMWRQCLFIPAEVTGMSVEGRLGDIVLDHGPLAYQEPDMYHPTNMVVPYKVGIWLYDDGEVLAPVSAAINPQRMVNRFLSILENQLNNSGGSAPVFDTDMFESEGDKEDAVKSVKKGKPVFVSAKGMGVQNAVGNYNSTVKESTLILANLIENYKTGMEQTTGVTDTMKGGQTPDQLVGVMQLSLQRGSITQQPFYSALQSIYQGCDQAIITSGKRLYIDNDTELIDIVGDEGATMFKISKDIRNESFRTALKIGLDPDLERKETDGMILTFAQYQLLDEPRVSNLIGRASLEEVYMAVREFSKEKQEMKRIAAQQAKQAQAQAQTQQAQAAQTVLGLNEQERQDAKEKALMDQQTGIAKSLIAKT